MSPLPQVLFLLLICKFSLANAEDFSNSTVELKDSQIEGDDQETSSNLTRKLKNFESLKRLQQDAEAWTKPPPLISINSLVEHPDWKRASVGDYGENRPISLRDLFTECLEGWEAPKILKETFPYYLAGIDDDGRPVWVAEAGKFDLRKIVEGNEKYLPLLDKYMRQGGYRVMKSVIGQLSLENRNIEFRFILDFDGLDIRQLLHLPTVSYALKYLSIYRTIVSNHAGPSVAINANYPTETFLSLMRPIWPAVLEKLDVYGTNKAKWLPRLRQHFPIEILPEWYGGSKHFAPLEVHG